MDPVSINGFTNNIHIPGRGNKMAEAWDLFQQKGIIAQGVRPVIASSWERSKKADPPAFQKPLSRNELKLRQEKMATILRTARPIMREICRLSGKNYIEFYDADGYSLEGYGNSIFPPVIGFNCSEEALGTNSIGIALKEDMPIRVEGFEHYAMWLHTYSCVAAPIHAQSGNIVGVISIINPYGQLPDWVFQILCLGAQIIEKGLHNNGDSEDITKIKNTFEKIVNLVTKESGANKKNQGPLGNTPEDLHPYTKREDLIGKNNVSFDFTQFISGKKRGETSPNLMAKKGKDQSKSQGDQGNWELLKGVNPVWQEIRKTIEKAIPYQPNVLIEGETGTGKEIIARTFHNLSGRKGKFVPINCGAIPAELLESELFGYEEGAFTGAKKGGNLGKFAWADEGTIFLDEIGEMPLSMQVSLLRFLQDKTIIPVGGNTPRKLNVQIIAATNRNLEEEIAKGNFRSDLYYRLNVVNIYLPPLRHRRDDLPWLINLLLEELGREHNKRVQVTEEAVALLGRYHWPGNVRELRNVLERGYIQSEGGWITPKDLPQFLTDQSPQSHEKTGYFKDRVEIKEKTVIMETLEACQGNISATARKLGISRVTLYKKMKNLGIQR